LRRRNRFWGEGSEGGRSPPPSQLARVSGSILAGVRGFVFDLDGCVWNGSALNPGAGEALAALHGADRGLVFLTNNSRATADDIRRRLWALGITFAEHTLTPLEIIGEVIARRFGPESAATAMVGDSVASDIKGARQLGMRTVLYAPAGGASTPEADLVVRSFAELARVAGVA